MSNVRYIISDAAKKIEVEPHVLRYWEEELGLTIPRNEMGHRYYREEDIEMMKEVKLLKDQGFQLRAVKMVLSDIHKIVKLEPKSLLKLREELNQQIFSVEGTSRKTEAAKASEEKNEENKAGTASVVSFEEKAAELGKNRGTSLAARESGGDVVEESQEAKMSQFKLIMHNLIVEALRENNHDLSMAVSTNVSESVLKEMDYMMRMKEEREEERYKRIDEAIRGRQKARREVAAAQADSRKKKSGIFKKKR